MPRENIPPEVWEEALEIPPPADDQDSARAFAWVTLWALRARDLARHGDERGMMSGDYLTDEQAGRIVVGMLRDCTARKVPPAAELVQLASYMLCKNSDPATVPHFLDKLYPARPALREVERFAYAVDWMLANERWAKSKRLRQALADAAGVDPKTIDGIVQSDEWKRLFPSRES